MTQDEKQALIDIQGSAGFKVLENLVKLRIEDLKSVESLDERSIEKAGIQALAQKKAVKLLKDLLSDIGFNVTIKDNNTYE